MSKIKQSRKTKKLYTDIRAIYENIKRRTIMEIKNLTNEDLKIAAQKSDLNFNNKIDSEELSVFITNAKRSGCEIQAILDIADSFGVMQNDRMVDEKTKIAQLKEIETLEKEIQTKKAELEERKYNYDRKKPYKEHNSSASIAGILPGAAIGAIAGAKAGTLLAGAVASTVVGTVVAPAIPFVCAFVGCVAGAFGGGYLAGTAIPTAVSEEYQNEKDIANDYNNDVVEPLEKHIKELEKELDKKLKMFYK